MNRGIRPRRKFPIPPDDAEHDGSEHDRLPGPERPLPQAGRHFDYRERRCVQPAQFRERKALGGALVMRGCPVRCWNSRVANSVPAVDESTLRDLFDADRGWGQPIEGSDEMVHVAVASNPPEALFRFQ